MKRRKSPPKRKSARQPRRLDRVVCFKERQKLLHKLRTAQVDDFFDRHPIGKEYLSLFPSLYVPSAHHHKPRPKRVHKRR